ncbi:MAG: cache domain-containing protein, partial [Planctomycetes bacterium]|nr:cache domain-containing protein [Planctomycetota bacterium]
MKLKIGGKLMLGGLATLLPVAAAGVLVLHLASTSLEERIFAQQTEGRDALKARAEAALAKLEVDAGMLQADMGALWLAGQNRMEAAQKAQAGEIAAYFANHEATMANWSQSAFCVVAAADMTAAYNSYGAELRLDEAGKAAAARDARDYYTREFGAEYSRRNGGRAADTNVVSAKLGENGQLLHATYIARNPNPLGSKHLADTMPDGSTYSAVHARVHPVLRNLVLSEGLYDIFIVDAANGDVVYTMYKELDFATNLRTGPWAASGLAQCFTKTLGLQAGQVCMVDYAPYVPSYDAPASFIGAPIIDGDKCVAVLMVQAPIDRLNAVTARGSSGATGESFLVGADYLMRSDARLDTAARSVNASFAAPAAGSVRTADVVGALKGETGAAVLTDYRDREVLSFYAPVKVIGLNWAHVAKVDIVELLNPANGEGEPYLASFTKARGLEDLLLVSAGGNVLFGAAGGKEVGTNLLTGGYRGSAAAKALKQATESRKVAMTDYAAYEPAGG